MGPSGPAAIHAIEVRKFKFRDQTEVGLPERSDRVLDTIFKFYSGLRMNKMVDETSKIFPVQI